MSEHNSKKHNQKDQLKIKSADIKLPDTIKKKLKKVFDETHKIVKLSQEKIPDNMLCKNIQFRYSDSHGGPLLTDTERAQIISFTNRYNNLPEFGNLKITEDKKDHFIISNLSELRHIINEYRSIIFNKTDSVFYRGVHKLLRDKLLNRDPKKGLSIQISNEDSKDITQDFLNMLDGQMKAVGIILKCCDCEYLYNGVLQHSGSEYTERLLKDNASGQLNYIFIKNTLLLTEIKYLLYWHCFVLVKLAGSTLGPL